MSRRKRKAWLKKRDHVAWLRYQDNNSATEFIYKPIAKHLTRKTARQLVEDNNHEGFITKDLAYDEMMQVCQILQIEGPSMEMAFDFLMKRNCYFSRIELVAPFPPSKRPRSCWIDYPAKRKVWDPNNPLQTKRP